jgi:hypothetical protein
MVIVCWMLAGFFHDAERRHVFRALAGGVLLHFLLDAPQKHIAAGYFWLFPFSWTTYKWGLWWSEDSVQIVPWVVLLVAIVEILIYFQRQANRNQKGFSNKQMPNG